MTYRISGLSPADFAHLFTLDDVALAAKGARRVTASGPGFPCRISLTDAAAGDRLILCHHVSHDVTTPYRSAYAIYVGEGAVQGHYVDEPAPVMRNRPMGLRGFDSNAMLADARLAAPGDADAAIRALFDNPAIAYIDAHNAAHGCFAARIERHSHAGY